MTPRAVPLVLSSLLALGCTSFSGADVTEAGGAGAGGAGAGGAVSCKEAADCGDPAAKICDPDTKTCGAIQCDAQKTCAASETCLLQSDGVTGGACYTTCVPTAAGSTCGAGRDCTPVLGDLSGFCRDTGAAATGQACSGGATTTGCQAGNVCVDEGNGSALCHKACDYWDPKSTCPAGQVCLNGGFCFAVPDPSFDPAKLGQPCTQPQGTPCGQTATNEAGICVDFQDGSGLACHKFCRTSGSDCTAGTCQAVFTDVTDFGLCSGLEAQPTPCAEAEQCGDTSANVCDPATLTCSATVICDATTACAAGQSCLGQVANATIGACYPSCVPFGASTCGAGKDCTPFLSATEGVCKATGAAALGAACTESDTSTSCVAGARCDGANCRKNCNNWAANPGCAAGQACTVDNLCQPTGKISNVAYGAACPAGLDYCGPTVNGSADGACVDFGGGSRTCTQLCRIGGADCSGGKTCQDIFGLGDVGACQ